MEMEDSVNLPEAKNNDEKVMSVIMNIVNKITDIESDEDTFTLQVTDDSDLENNLSESVEINNAESQKSSDSSSEKEKTLSIRILSDTYYDDDDDDDDDNCCDTDKQGMVQSRQAEVIDSVQSDCVERSREQTIENSREDTQDNCSENQNESIGENSGLEVSLRDFIENHEYLSSVLDGIDFNDERIGVNLEEQALEDLELLISQEKNQNSTQVGSIDREPAVVEIDNNFKELQRLEDSDLLMNQKKKQNSTQIENVNHESAVFKIDDNLKKQRALEDLELLVNQKEIKNYRQVENDNRELEEGELEESENEMHRETAREQREKSAELIEVPDEVNDRLFCNIDDNFSDVSTIEDNSYYDDLDCTTPNRNPSPPDEGEFSAFEDDDPWDYVQSSLSDDCVIVDEIECPRKLVESDTIPPENLSEYSTNKDDSKDHNDEEEEYAERYHDRRKTSRKRKSSTSSNHETTEEINIGTNNVDHNYDDFSGICSREEVSEFLDDVEKVSKKKRCHYGRDEDHPFFRDIDVEFCEKLMRVKNQGEIIIRPSSKGSDYMKITWKVTDGIYQHIKVKKKLKGSSSKYRYWINNKEFRSLDEMINLHITPMAKNALELLCYKHFKKGINGVKATAEELLKAEKNKNPNYIPYIISAVKKYPGKFLISYLPRLTCYHEYIKVVPDGFRFRDQSFDNLNDLFIYFKANSKEVKSTALKDQALISTTTSRPATPRPMTPKNHELTPSILEVIQDLPDEKLESMRLILDSLAQSTSNQPTNFHQNPTPNPFMFNGYRQQFPPVSFPTVPFSSYQPIFRPAGLGFPPTNNEPLPVPYSKNLDLPVPNYNQPSTSRVINLPLPPGT